MSVMASRPFVRWVVPGGVLAAVLGGGAIATTMSASAQASLPPRSPAALLADVETASLDAASGTVIEKADLGLPELPDIGGFGNDSANLNSLISGSHTLRVWYSGPDKARVALLGAMGESDIIRNGTDVWIWNSKANTARHTVLDGKAKPPRPEPSALPTDLPKTPQEAAEAIVAKLDPTTNLSVDQTATVAGRPVYTLVLTPKDSASQVARVTIGIDGTKHVPLQVQVFAKGYAPPAFKIGFTDVNFTRPDASRFAFTPPPGATVTQASPSQDASKAGAAQHPRIAVIGKGWTSVVAARLPQPDAVGPLGPKGGSPDRAGEPSLGSLLNALPHVQGSWGSGRVLHSRLFSVLLTDDGRVIAGAVSTDQLLKAAADPAAALK